MGAAVASPKTNCNDEFGLCFMSAHLATFTLRGNTNFEEAHERAVTSRAARRS
jgi:hypothetical protein